MPLATNSDVPLVALYGDVYIPGSSQCVKFVPFHPKNLPKGRFFSYLEDPGINIVYI